MKIKMHSSNCKITKGMADAAEKSLNRCARWIDEAATLDVTCRIEKEIQEVEIVMNGVRTPIVATAVSHDYYESLDVAVQRFEKQLIKARKRRIDLKRTLKPTPRQNEKNFKEKVMDVPVMDEDVAVLMLKKQDEEAMIFLDQEQELAHLICSE